MTELRTDITLGSYTDCELCGSSYNLLIYTFDLETGEHTIETFVGCSGGSVFTDLNTVRAVHHLLGLVPDYPDAATALRDLADGLGRYFG